MAEQIGEEEPEINISLRGELQELKKHRDTIIPLVLLLLLILVIYGSFKLGMFHACYNSGAKGLSTNGIIRGKCIFEQKNLSIEEYLGIQDPYAKDNNKWN